MHCDACAVVLAGLDSGEDGPALGVRFTYHPGDPGMRDDSGVLCGRCWAGWAVELGRPRKRVCALCGAAVSRLQSLHLRRLDHPEGWQLCARHAAERLNLLRTVEPKFDADTFRLPLDTSQVRS
ncbi:MAG: hypothetical protein L0K86_07965 [Actinomycetia bacterium]|nr:hypothetical protein [Actinomycetes bacterium]